MLNFFELHCVTDIIVYYSLSGKKTDGCLKFFYGRKLLFKTTAAICNFISVNQEVALILFKSLAPFHFFRNLLEACLVSQFCTPGCSAELEPCKSQQLSLFWRTQNTSLLHNNVFPHA